MDKHYSHIAAYYWHQRKINSLWQADRDAWEKIAVHFNYLSGCYQ